MPDITVASTTDTQEQVNVVAGLPPETKPAEGELGGKPSEGEPEVPTEGDEGKPPETPEGETPETEDDKPVTAAEPESATPADKGDKGKPQPSRKKGWQDRVDELTRDKYKLRGENDELRRRLERLEEAGTKPKDEPPAKPVAQAPETLEALGPEPNPDQFLNDGKTYEDYTKALWAYLDKKKGIEAKQREANEQRQAEEARLRESFDAHNQRMDDAASRYEDFDGVVNNPDIQIPKAVRVAIVEDENGPDIAYYLGKNPQVCEELMEMTPAQAVMHIGRISAALEAEQTPASSNAGGEKPPKVSSSAPSPLKPLGGSSTKSSSVPLDQLPYSEYRRIRDQQARDRTG